MADREEASSSAPGEPDAESLMSLQGEWDQLMDSIYAREVCRIEESQWGLAIDPPAPAPVPGSRSPVARQWSGLSPTAKSPSPPTMSPSGLKRLLHRVTDKFALTRVIKGRYPFQATGLEALVSHSPNQCLIVKPHETLSDLSKRSESEVREISEAAESNGVSIKYDKWLTD